MGPGRVELTHCGLVTPYGDKDGLIWVNTGSGNGLLPHGTKPWIELLLISHRWGTISQYVLKLLICVLNVKMILLILLPQLPGANGLMVCIWVQFYGLVQERHNSIANALELRLSCTNPSSWCYKILLSLNGWYLFKSIHMKLLSRDKVIVIKMIYYHLKSIFLTLHELQ